MYSGEPDNNASLGTPAGGGVELEHLVQTLLAAASDGPQQHLLVQTGVRAMVMRNANSLDQMIGKALGDTAARLQSPASVREQRDDIARARQRSDLKSGTF